MAQQLISTKPHAWLSCSILGTSAAMALAERDFAEATAILEQLRTTAREHGLTADYARANVNLGNLAFLTGRYDAAELALQDAIDSPHTSRVAKLTAAETLADLRLSQGRLDECGDILRQIELSSAQGSLGNVFAVQWSKLTQARLLLRRGDANLAAEQLKRLESGIGEVSDRALMAATRMTAAQALGMNGDPAGAARHLASSFMLDPTAIPELQGQFYYAASAAVSTDNDRLADALRSRARRVWASHGTSSLERAFPTSSLRTTPSTDVTQNSRIDEFTTVESLASLFALAAYPRLLGDELYNTIRRLQCSPGVTLADISQEHSDREGLELLLPQRDSSVLRLSCTIPDSPAKAIALSSIVRIGQYAVELERLRDAERQRAALWPDASPEATAGAVFDSDAMREILTVVRRIADTPVPVLITGETGTGKEVLARLIHNYSSRSKAQFMPFNCTSMSRDVLESQLFGHRKGAFTGATDSSQGVIRTAHRGTLLLDEIGDMPLDVQPKLLRFLESGEIHPLGESKPSQVDVRVVAATNVDLKALVSSGKFREDLYYRLSIVRLHLPPLRERRGEIPALATHYLKKHGQELRKGDLRLSEDAMEYLLLFRWPGNVRQLANEMRRVAALAEVGAVIMPEHLDTDITGGFPPRTHEAPRREMRDNEIIVRTDQPLAAIVEHVERVMIPRAIAQCGGNMERAATLLGLSRKGLYLKRQKYQIGVLEADPELDDDAGD